jgi:hypothetical protein
MRREIVQAYLRVGVALVIGAVFGRFVLPRLEPQTKHHVSVFADPQGEGCSLAMTDVTTLVGKTINPGEQWYHKVGCSEFVDYASTVIDCRCPPKP